MRSLDNLGVLHHLSRRSDKGMAEEVKRGIAVFAQRAVDNAAERSDFASSQHSASKLVALSCDKCSDIDLHLRSMLLASAQVGINDSESPHAAVKR